MTIRKQQLFGIPVSVLTREECVGTVLAHAQQETLCTVAFMPVHSLMTAVQNPVYKTAIEQFDIIAPDGQPVRWALNHFHKSGLSERVYGPDVTLDICREAEKRKIPVYFYGSTESVLELLRINLQRQFSDLIIAGMKSPSFGEIPESELQDDCDQIVASGAKILFVGLGCPKQELLTVRMKEYLSMPILAVGAAFDFHAGTLTQAPKWMQNHGLEWLFRLWKEPRRLWKRYVVYNSRFMWAVLKEMAKGRVAKMR